MVRNGRGKNRTEIEGEKSDRNGRVKTGQKMKRKRAVVQEENG